MRAARIAVLVCATASCARCASTSDAPDTGPPVTYPNIPEAAPPPTATVGTMMRGDASVPIVSAVARSVPGSKAVALSLRTKPAGCENDAGANEGDVDLVLAPMILLAGDGGYYAPKQPVWHVVSTNPPAVERENRDYGTATVPAGVTKVGATGKIHLSFEAVLASSACIIDDNCTKIGMHGSVDVTGCGEATLDDAGAPRPQEALKMVIGGEPVTIRGATYREETQRSLLGVSKILELSTEPLACDGPRLPADVHVTIIANSAYAKFYFESLRLPNGTFVSTPLDLDVPQHVEEGGRKVIIGFKDNTDLEPKRGFPLVLGGKVTAIHCGHEGHRHDASAPE